MSVDQAFGWSSALMAWAVFWQSAEFLALRKSLRSDGVWSWQLLREDLGPCLLRRVLDPIYRDRVFECLLALRILLALLVWVAPSWALGLLAMSTPLVSLRWRGAFNGASDAQTWWILVVLWIAWTFDLQQSMLYLLVVHALLGYVTAGWVKLREKGWRSGEFLGRFLLLPQYDVPSPMRAWARHPWLLKVLSWMILSFELSFPLLLIGSGWTWAYLGGGVVFHAANIYLFGLNRFFWVWLALYPPLFYVSSIF